MGRIRRFGLAGIGMVVIAAAVFVAVVGLYVHDHGILEVAVDGESIDPTTHLLQDGDDVAVTVDTADGS